MWQEQRTPMPHGRVALPHPRFCGGMPSSASPYKGEGKESPSFWFPLCGQFLILSTND